MNMRRKWSTNTAFPDASQTMPNTGKEHFLNSLKMSSRGRLSLDSQITVILVYQEIKTRSIDRFSFSNVSDGVLETIKVQRKPPKIRIFQGDQLKEFKKTNSITSLDDINEKQMKSLGEGSFLEKEFYRSYHVAFP